MALTGLADFAKTDHMFLDKHLILGFMESWHDETSSFHFPAGEMTVTLYDVSCLLHLPNGGRLLQHQSLRRAEGVGLMVKQLGSDASDALEETHITKGAHARTTYLKTHFKYLVERVANFVAEEDEAKSHQNFAVRTYLLMLVGCTFFADNSKNVVHLFYLEYFEDLVTVSELAWGSVALTHLYKGLSTTTTHKASTVSGYMTLLQVTSFI
jgi:hypothetical protein